ncbi:MAG: amidohydrolase, partial [archaeon]|nr:amidohydrolase [archaeon]
MIYTIRNCRILSPSGKTRIVDLASSHGKIVSIARSRIDHRKKLNEYNAKGKLVLPAFTDCHCHLFSLAEQASEVQLRDCKSIREMQNRIEEYIRTQSPSQKSGWIYGRGWDQDLFAERRLPSKTDLDAITDVTPIVMTRICGHIAVMNSKALDFFVKKGAFLNLSEELVPRDARGEFSGIVEETALTNCWARIPKPSLEDLQRLFLKGQSEALHYGLSGVHCILDDLDQLDAIRKLDTKGKIKLRVGLFLPIYALQTIEQTKVNQRKNLLIGKKVRVIGFKLFADGSLGARTAALNQDYSDDPGNKGVLNYSDDQIIDYAKRAKRLNLVLASHAIGDRAVEQVAKAYKKAAVTSKDHFRIEHCSIVRPQEISNLSGIVLSVQPMFATSDFWLNKRIGNSKSKRVGYIFRTLARKNVLLGGSDAPVESINPLTGIAAAIDNQANPKESLSIIQAIQIYTKNAAKLSPFTQSSGTIEVGKECNVVVLDVDNLASIAKSRVTDLFIEGKRMQTQGNA